MVENMGYRVDEFDSESIINFYYLYYCTLEGDTWIFGAVSLIIFAIGMYMLASTADEYLGSALETISDKLNISETISAVTLLALGNGAPDIFSSFSAAGSPEGIYLSLSSSMGGLVFITSVITGVVIVSSGSNNVQTDRTVFFRNTLFLLLSIIILLITGTIFKTINIIICAIFLIIYIVYIAFVVKHDSHERAIKSKQEWMFNEMKQTSFKRMNRSEILNLMDDEFAYNQGITPSGEVNGTSSVIYDGNEIKPDEVLHFSINSGSDLDSQRTDNKIKKLAGDYKESSWVMAKHLIFQLSKTNADKYREKSGVELIKGYIRIRRLTIPMTHTDNWNRNIDSWTPILSTLFFLYTTGLLNIYDAVQIFVLSTMLSLSVLIRFNTYHSEPPPSPYAECFIMHSFIMSIVWIWVLANIVVDLVTIYGHIFEISSTFLGVSFLALGNCGGDAMAAYSISKKGYGGMAMTGCFACPLFNFLIGFSLSSMRLLFFDDSQQDKTILQRGIKFDLFDNNAQVLMIAMVVILLVLASFLAGVPNNAFKFSSRQAYARFAIYIGFISILVFLLML